MSKPSCLAALIGAGIASSLTPPMHEREGARKGLNYVYRTLDITALGMPPEAVGDLVRAAMALGFDGLNITHPCKQLVIPHLDDLSPEAAAVDAVNTVVFHDGRATGHNTDVTGFAKSFAHGLPHAATGIVVQVGAGGAGSAVAHALLTLGADRLVVTDLDAARAERLTARLQDRFGSERVRHADASRLDDAVAAADGVVNTTPVGMAAHPGSAVPTELLRPGLWVADIVYRPVRTELVRSAEDAGCVVLNGAGMAVFQAVDAFALITGRDPDADAMFADFHELVALESVEGTA